MSNKRILPALLLAGSVGFLGLHRIYAGRYVTGFLQFAFFAIGAAMLWRELPGLQTLESLQTIDDIDAFVLNHPIHPLPVFLTAISSFWALFDCVMLIRRKFRDGTGEKITRWV